MSRRKFFDYEEEYEPDFEYRAHDRKKVDRRRKKKMKNILRDSAFDDD